LVTQVCSCVTFALLRSHREITHDAQMKYFLLAATVLAACVPVSGTNQPSLDDRPFDALNHEERIEFMKQRVMPTMQPVFVEHDAAKFGNFSCRTCHGPGADQGEFHMPNDALPKLSGDLTRKFPRPKLDWMLMEVKPTMAKLLKVKEWSPEDPYGFDCFACHTRER
jgi:hypothetical protein